VANNQQLAVDTFASGALAAGWSANSFGLFAVIGGSTGNYYAKPPNNTTAGVQMWTALSWPNDQGVDLIIKAIPDASGVIAAMLRWQSLTVISGYAIEFTNIQLTIYQYTNGTPTVIKTASVTPAVGDLWSYQIAGAQIAVYQNGKRITWVADTTWTSGTAGFWVSSTTPNTNSQVSAWRGYSFVQQCGVWTKQQIAIPAIAGETLGTSSEHVFIDNNPQILAGSTFACFFNGGSYAESYDGKAWTRYSSNPVLAGFSQSRVFKFGSTYYLYAIAAAGTSCAVYTSTNKISWTLQNASVITTGAGGTWDASQIYNFTVVDNITGTWYAIYSAQNATGVGAMGLATSPDLINWTKYGSNPVYTGIFGSAPPLKIGGVYYLWGTGWPLGADVGEFNVDPGESIRIQSTNLINWTNLIHSFGNNQFVEGVNANGVGLAFWNSIVQVGNQTYGYYDTGPTDGTGFWQAALAIAPAPPSTLVAFKEDATVAVGSDNFSGTLSKWTTQAGASTLQIVGGKLEASATNTACSMVFTGANFGPNHYSEFTIATMSASTSHLQATVRAIVGAFTCYVLGLAGPTGSQRLGGINIYKTVAGTNYIIAAAAPAVTPQVGDVFRLMVTTGPNGNPILSGYQNGYLLIEVEDPGLVGGPPLTAGGPGMYIFESVALGNSQVSAWGGGNASQLPYASNQGDVGPGFDLTYRL
jgi:hypothetical protein